MGELYENVMEGKGAGEVVGGAFADVFKARGE
jgi:hypothetical protein